jgi:hypothetical protein
MAMGYFDCHAAPDYAVIKSFQFFGFRADPILDLCGMLHIAKCDLKWKRHGPLPKK